MTAIEARKFTLALGNGGDPQVFTEIGGIQSHMMQLVNTIKADISTDKTNAWNYAHSGLGRKRLTVSVEGVFTDSMVEEALRFNAFAHETPDFEIRMGTGDRMRGAFAIVEYQRHAGMEGAVQYRCVLQSAGEISFTAAS